MPDPLPALNRSELDQIRGWRPSRLRTNGEDHTEYRAGYRAFRTGGTHGARETSCGPRGAHAETWLLDHGWDNLHTESAWRWRHTVSYWVAILFCVGSAFFVIGSAFGMNSKLSAVQERATVAHPFFVGSIAFTLGSYFGFYHIVNVGREHPKWFRAIDAKTPAESYWGYFAFTLGALAFNANTSVALFEWRAPKGGGGAGGGGTGAALEWGAATAGSLLFVAGSALELRHNDWREQLRRPWRETAADLGFVVAVFNEVGSLLFLLASVSGLCGAPKSKPLTLGPWLVGSACFLIASLIQLWMWSREQYGLAFLRPLNRFAGGGAIDSAAQHPKVSRGQFAWIMLFMFCFCCSVMDLSFMLLSTSQRELSYLAADDAAAAGAADDHKPAEAAPFWSPSTVRDAWDLANVIVVCTTVLILSSVMHRVPAQPPFDLLVHLLRFIMALHAGRFAFSWWVYWRWWRFIEEAEGDAGGGLANATVAALASAGHDYALWAASREAI